jgi:multidrug efflux pump subunit AcrA (membrane-fusion protein)
MVIPLSAVHNRQVYVITDQNRLKRHAVTLGFRGSDYVIVEAGLDPGDRIVISDLVPAIDGMLLEPIEDAQASAQLLASAAGGADP